MLMDFNLRNSPDLSYLRRSVLHLTRQNIYTVFKHHWAWYESSCNLACSAMLAQLLPSCKLDKNAERNIQGMPADHLIEMQSYVCCVF